MGQTVLNRTEQSLLYKPCWPGSVQLTSTQFYDCFYTVKQTGLTRAGPQKCVSVVVPITNLHVVLVLVLVQKQNQLVLVIDKVQSRFSF